MRRLILDISSCDLFLNICGGETDGETVQLWDTELTKLYIYT